MSYQFDRKYSLTISKPPQIDKTPKVINSTDESIVVKKEDILHFIRLTKTHSAIGGTIIWIKNITIYQQDKSFVSQKNAQQLFNGDIYNEYVSSIKDKQTTSHSKNTHTPGCSCEH